MSTDFVYLQGKGKWCKVTTPDAKFGDPKWSVVLYPNPDSYNKLLDLKKKGIRNMIKKDEDGYFTTFSRPQEKKYRGRINAFTPPELLDGTKPLEDGGYMPFPRENLIGNGSDITIKLAVYTFSTPGDKPGERTGCAARLESVRIDNLIPYNPNRDMDEVQKGLVRGMDEQPTQPLF